MTAQIHATIKELFAPSLASRLSAVVSAWSQETSAKPNGWSDGNRAIGQADVTALVVQDLAGGDIVAGLACLPNGRRIHHCWNKLGFMEFDLTISQFPDGTGIEPESCFVQRGDLLNIPAIRRRYELLHSRYWIALVCAGVAEGRF
jgi:hypothetical protein